MRGCILDNERRGVTATNLLRPSRRGRSLSGWGGGFLRHCSAATTHACMHVESCRRMQEGIRTLANPHRFSYASLWRLIPTETEHMSIGPTPGRHTAHQVAGSSGMRNFAWPTAYQAIQSTFLWQSHFDRSGCGCEKLTQAGRIRWPATGPSQPLASASHTPSGSRFSVPAHEKPQRHRSSSLGLSCCQRGEHAGWWQAGAVSWPNTRGRWTVRHDIAWFQFRGHGKARWLRRGCVLVLLWLWHLHRRCFFIIPAQHVCALPSLAAHHDARLPPPSSLPHRWVHPTPARPPARPSVRSSIRPPTGPIHPSGDVADLIRDTLKLPHLTRTYPVHTPPPPPPTHEHTDAMGGRRAASGLRQSHSQKRGGMRWNVTRLRRRSRSRASSGGGGGVSGGGRTRTAPPTPPHAHTRGTARVSVIRYYCCSIFGEGNWGESAQHDR